MGKVTTHPMVALAKKAITGGAAGIRANGPADANLVTLFVPDVIALGGGVMKSLPLFIDRLRTTVQQSCGLAPFQCVCMRPIGRVLGAGHVWLAAQSTCPLN